VTYRGRTKERRRAEHRQLVRWIAANPDSVTALMAAYVRYLDLMIEQLKAPRRRAR
jgi:hypothetical protein